MSDVLDGKKYATCSLTTSLGAIGHTGMWDSSPCYIVIQGSRCWSRLSDMACSQAKAAGPASAESSLLQGPRPYFNPMWKHLTRPATPCGVQHQVILAGSFAQVCLIPGLLLVFGTPQFLLRSHLLYIPHLTQPPIHSTKFSSRPPESPQALISHWHALHAVGSALVGKQEQENDKTQQPLRSQCLMLPIRNLLKWHLPRLHVIASKT